MSSLPLFRGKPLYAKFSDKPAPGGSVIREAHEALLKEGKPIRVRMKNQLSPASNSKSPKRYDSTCSLIYASGATVEVTFTELTVTMTHKFADQKVRLSMPNDHLMCDRRSELRWTRKQAKDASLEAIKDLYELAIVALASAEMQSDEKREVQTDIHDITRLINTLNEASNINMIFLSGPFWGGGISANIPDKDDGPLVQKFFEQCMPYGVMIIPSAPDVDYHLAKMVDFSTLTIDPMVRLNAIQRWQQRLDDLQGDV